jgi:hypothetical protein
MFFNSIYQPENCHKKIIKLISITNTQGTTVMLLCPTALLLSAHCCSNVTDALSEFKHGINYHKQ